MAGCTFVVTLVPELATDDETIATVRQVLGENLGRMGFGPLGDVT